MNHFKKELMKSLTLIVLMSLFLIPAFALTSCCDRKSTQEICQGWTVGDVVKLKIGSPEMAIIKRWRCRGKCKVEVAWTSSENEAEHAEYPVEVLEKIKSANDDLEDNF